MNHDWETIIEIGAEGGTIRLLGKEEQPGKWVYRRSVNEIFTEELVSESVSGKQKVRTL
ncbi:hypothetical protein [Neobacillus sp. Marseille-QA0830]